MRTSVDRGTPDSKKPWRKRLYPIGITIGSLVLACLIIVGALACTTNNNAPPPPHSQRAHVTPQNIDTSIELGIDWLADNQNPDGSWGTTYTVGETGLAVLKLEDRAFELGFDTPFDPDYEYSENVTNGLNFLFSQAHTVGSAMNPLPLQQHGNNMDNPDSNGNGMGVYFGGLDPTYETGIAMMAIAASRYPSKVVGDPDPVPGPINGWSYGDVLQDAVDYLAFGQEEVNPYRGGWHYGPNSGTADNSCSGYAVIGLQYAENPYYGFNCIIPQFVRNELCYWIDYIQNQTTGGSTYTYGGSGYGTPSYWVNTLKTGNLLCEMAFVGETQGNQKVQEAINYIGHYWYDQSIDPGWGWDYTNIAAYYQATYCLMKGLQSMGVVANGVPGVADWYHDLADIIVPQQINDPQDLNYGSWLVSYNHAGPGATTTAADRGLSTIWALLTLEMSAPPLCGDNCGCMDDSIAVSCNFTQCDNVTTSCSNNIITACSDNVTRHCYTCPQGCECRPEVASENLTECAPSCPNPCPAGQRCYKSLCQDGMTSCDNITNLVDTVILNTGYDRVTGLPLDQSLLHTPSTLPELNWMLTIAPEVINPPADIYGCGIYPHVTTPATSLWMPSPAWVIEKSLGWIDSNPLTSRWISAYPKHTWQVNNSNPCPHQDYSIMTQPVQWQYPPYRFERAFCVCSDNTDIVINFDLLVDNIADIYLDNVYIGGQMDTWYGSFQQPKNITTTRNVNSGVHHLYVDIRNDSGVSMGLNVSGSITASSGLPIFLDDIHCQPTGKLIVKKVLSDNSTVEPNEPGLPGWIIMVTDNATGAVTENITDANGYSYFNYLCPGTYTVCEEPQPNWIQTIPGGQGCYTVTLQAGSIIEVDFGNYQVSCGDNCTCLEDSVADNCSFVLCDNVTTSCSDNITAHCYTCPQGCECLASDNATGLQECLPVPNNCPNPCPTGKKCYKSPECECAGYDNVTVTWYGPQGPGTWTGPCGDRVAISAVNPNIPIYVTANENCSAGCNLTENWTVTDSSNAIIQHDNGSTAVFIPPASGGYIVAFSAYCDNITCPPCSIIITLCTCGSCLEAGAGNPPCNLIRCDNETTPCKPSFAQTWCYSCPQGCVCLPSDNATGMQECLPGSCSMYNPCPSGQKCYKCTCHSLGNPVTVNWPSNSPPTSWSGTIGGTDHPVITNVNTYSSIYVVPTFNSIWCSPGSPTYHWWVMLGSNLVNDGTGANADFQAQPISQPGGWMPTAGVQVYTVTWDVTCDNCTCPGACSLTIECPYSNAPIYKTLLIILIVLIVIAGMGYFAYRRRGVPVTRRRAVPRPAARAAAKRASSKRAASKTKKPAAK